MFFGYFWKMRNLINMKLVIFNKSFKPIDFMPPKLWPMTTFGTPIATPNRTSLPCNHPTIMALLPYPLPQVWTQYTKTKRSIKLDILKWNLTNIELFGNLGNWVKPSICKHHYFVGEKLLIVMQKRFVAASNLIIKKWLGLFIDWMIITCIKSM